MASDVMTDVL